MEEKGVKQIKKLIPEFRLLTTKAQKNNQVKSKSLKETDQVLEKPSKKISKTISRKWIHKAKDSWTTRGIAQISKPA